MKEYLSNIDELLRLSGSTSATMPTMETEETARQYLAFHNHQQSTTSESHRTSQ